MKLHRFLAAGLFALAGCSSIPIDIERAPRAPVTAVMDPSLLDAADSKGTLRIARDGGVVGIAMTAAIYLDGRHVANSEGNRVLILHVPAGAHKLGIQVQSSWDPLVYQDVQVEAGAVYDYRVSVSGNGFRGDWRMERLN